MLDAWVTPHKRESGHSLPCGDTVVHMFVSKVCSEVEAQKPDRMIDIDHSFLCCCACPAGQQELLDSIECDHALRAVQDSENSFDRAESDHALHGLQDTGNS